MENIQIIAVGWSEETLTLGAIQRLRAGLRVVLRTKRCGAADWLKRENIPFESLDDLYEQCEDFDELIHRTACRVMDLAEVEPVVYCVSDLADRTCLRITEMARDIVELVPGVPQGENLRAYTTGELRIIYAADAELFMADAHMDTLVLEIDNVVLASEMKLRLMECYPEETLIFISHADGSVNRYPLYELDQLNHYDHRLCALIPSQKDITHLQRYSLSHLEEIMRRLRKEDAWDREQTHHTLRPYMIEEAYEAVEAIDREDMDALYDELGDVLLQVVLHAEIARQYGEFDLSDVTTAICRKMIRRHAHIFGDAHANTLEEIHALWDDTKRKEKSISSLAEELQAVSTSLPALLRAGKIGKKAAEHGIHMPDVHEAWRNFEKHPGEKTLGEMLLALALGARRGDVEPETALIGALDNWLKKINIGEAKNNE